MKDASDTPASAETSGDKLKTAPDTPLRGPAPAARMRRRHLLLILSFVLWVLAPVSFSAWYLYGVAKDQYASHVGFSVRKEEVGSAIELLGGITELSGSSSSDTDILYEFIQSQQIVRLVDEKLDLTRIYHRPEDPIFSLGEDTRIEALADYWNRMIKVFYDSASGLIEVRVLAFDAQDAQDIALTLFDESSRMINELSAIARADAMSYAVEELDRAVERLKETRQAKIAFQNRTQIVDPSADIQGQMGLLNTLQSQLAATGIELRLLLDNSTPEGDPRVQQARRRIAAIEGLIEQERDKFGGAGSVVDSKDAYSELLGEFEALQVDLEFAQKSYLSAQAARDVAFAEAQRKSRYLAMHVAPTLAETPQYPRRLVLLGMLAALAFISWAIMVMIYYSLRDRR
ncbi:sugar transporter [Sulfitobacter aestuarii]|uniref:Sugar transporter n=1 Tax=Sulfitobacter aestuarii TaxID=2161676 RepID=A0ABW5U6I6_9RHOB